jgi:hypothetical protein
MSGGMKHFECWLLLMSRFLDSYPGIISDLLSSLPLVVLRIGFVYGPYVEFGLCNFLLIFFSMPRD